MPTLKAKTLSHAQGRDITYSGVWHWLQGVPSGGKNSLSPNRAIIYTVSLEWAGNTKNQNYWPRAVEGAHLVGRLVEQNALMEAWQNLQTSARYSFVSRVHYKAHHGWAGEIFKMEVLILIKIAILRLVFANTVFHKRVMLQIFYTEYTYGVFDILSYPEFTTGPLWLGQEKNFQNFGSQKPGKRYYMIGFSKCSNQLMYKYYAALNS